MCRQTGVLYPVYIREMGRALAYGEAMGEFEKLASRLLATLSSRAFFSQQLNFLAGLFFEESP